MKPKRGDSAADEEAKAHFRELKKLGNDPLLGLAYEQGVRDAAMMIEKAAAGGPESLAASGPFTEEEVRHCADLLVAAGELSRLEAEKRIRKVLGSR